MRDITNFILENDLNIPKIMNLDWDITDELNYWYKKGNNNILLVAHIDTLPRINNKKRFKEKASKLDLSFNNDIIRAKNSILGADDRAGCYAVWKLYHEYGCNCSILLTNFEETGGLGVKQFISDYPDLLSNYKMFIELDRTGIDEFVHYNGFIDDELSLTLYQFNFNEAIGSYSDIYDLTEHYRIQSFNLSTGYYNQHSKNEYLDFYALEKLLIPRYAQMIAELENLEGFFYIPEKSRFKYFEQEFTDSYSDRFDYLEYRDYLDYNLQKEFEQVNLRGYY